MSEDHTVLYQKGDQFKACLVANAPKLGIQNSLSKLDLEHL